MDLIFGDVKLKRWSSIDENIEIITLDPRIGINTLVTKKKLLAMCNSLRFSKKRTRNLKKYLKIVKNFNFLIDTTIKNFNQRNNNGFKCGILPVKCRPTLFNAQTSSFQAEINFFCTIEPNVGEVDVPDNRLFRLSNISSSKK